MKNKFTKILLICILFLVSSFAVTSVAYAMGNVVRDEEPATAENNFDEQGVDEGGDSGNSNPTPPPSTPEVTTETQTTSTTEATTEATTATQREQSNQAKTQKGKDSKESDSAGKVIAKPKTVTNSVEISKEIGDTLRVFFYSDAENLEVSCNLNDNPLALHRPVANWSNSGKNRICFVIDTKSSISQEKWEKIKNQIIQIQSKELLQNDSISIITTDKNGILDGSEQVEYTNVIPDADRLTTRLDEIIFDNETTNINKSLINVGEYLDVTTDDDTRSVIIAVTDGMIDAEMTASLKGRLTIYETPMYFIDAGDDSETSTRQLAASTTDGKTVDVSDTSVTDLYKHLTACKIAEFDLDPDRENAVYEMAFNFNTGSDEPETFKVNISLIGNKIYDETADSEEVATSGDATAGDATPGNAKGGEVTTEKPGNPGGSTKNPVKADDSGSSKKKIIVIILIAIFALILLAVILIIILKKKSGNKNAQDSLRQKEEARRNAERMFEEQETDRLTADEEQMRQIAQQLQQPVPQQAFRQQPSQPSQSGVSAKDKTTVGVPLIIELKSGGAVIDTINAKVDRSIIIGRSKICDIVINNENMSRQHLIIEYSDDSFYVQDLSTKNGTFFNGVRMTHKRRLEKGDVLKIGDLELIIRW